MGHPSIAPAAVPRGRGSLTAMARGSKKSGARSSDVRCVTMKPMLTKMHQKTCTTLFTRSGIGKESRDRLFNLLVERAAPALSGHIPDGRSLLEGHPNEGRPG